MSTTVDERVVSMQFDNKHFESNVKTTMSTLEKFKQSLSLKGASKGIENVQAAANKLDFKRIENTACEAGFHIQDVWQKMATVFEYQVARKIINAATDMTKALTITPISTGFNEYELKMNSVQTIMASTGEELSVVNKYLEELNEYSDKTIYSFSDMTQNIGKFTNAGVKLEDAVMAIKGISNEAAVSGANANEASRAMYNFAQALSVGYIQRIDWKSIELANMATVDFKENLLAAAIEMGTVTKNAEGMYATVANPDKWYNSAAMFTETLDDQWLTTDVLIGTLKDYADETTDIGKKATQAATEVKTFTQLMDTLKESAQSGWAKTWELIFGDFEEGKNLWTSISEGVGGFLDMMSNARNNLLEGALNLASPWTKIMEKLEGSGLGKIKEVAESVGEAADKLKYFQDIVTDVWRGDYKNSDTGRYELLEAAGYDHRVVQELVNKGYQYELTVEDIEAAHKKFGLTMGTTTKETEKLTKEVNNLSEEQLKKAGLTEEEIKLYQDLQTEADRTGKSVAELADEMSKNDGRTLLIESFKNAASGLVGIFKALGQAWVDIFPPMSVVQLYNIIKSINKFSKNLRLTDKETGKLTETCEKLMRTFKGVFALLDIVLTLVGGPLKWAFKAFVKILDAFDLDILDVTASMGDAIVKFRDWIDTNNIFVKGIKAAPELLAKFVKSIQKWLTGVRETDNIGEYIVDGLVNGIKNGIKTVVDKIAEFANKIIEKFCEILGIHSPSKVFFEFGKNIIEGLVNGILYMVGTVTGLIKGVGERIVDAFSFVDFGAILTVLAGGSLLKIGLNLSKGVAAIASPLEGLGDLMSDAGKVMRKSAGAIKKVINNFAKVTKSFANVMNSFAFSIKMEALKTFAIAVGILAGIVAVLALMIHNGMAKDMWHAVGIIGALAVIMGIVAIAVDKLASASTSIGKDGVKVTSMAGTLAAIGVAMLLMAAAVKVLGGLKAEQYEQGMWGLVGITGAMVLVVAAFTQMGTQGEKADKSIKNMGKILTRMAIAMLLMVGVIKLVGMLSKEELIKGAAFATAFMLFVAILAGSGKNDFTNQGDNMSDLGSMILKLVIAMGLMVGVCKLVAKLSKDEMIKGAAFAGAFVVFVGLLALIGKAAGGPGEMAKLGGMLLSMSLSMLLLVGVCKLVGMLSTEDMIKGGIFALAFAYFVGMIVAITKAGGSDLAKIGGTILALSVAIAVLAGVCVLLGYVNTDKLTQGLIAVGILSAMMAGILLAARGVQEAQGTMIGIAVTIGLLAAALVGLSFIDPKKLVAPTIAIGLLLGMFAVVLKSSKNISSSMGTMIAMAAAIAVLGTALAILSNMPWQQTLGAAGALSLVMLAMVGVLKLLSNTIAPSIAAMTAMISLSIILNIIGGAIKKLKDMSPETALTSAVALSTLLLVMSASLLILQDVQGPMVIALVSLTVISLIMYILADVITKLKDMAPGSAIGIAIALSTLLIAMSASLLILSAVGLTGPAAKIGVDVLITVITKLGAFVTAIGFLNDKIKGIDKFLNEGIGVLRLIGEAIGAFVGGLVAGFAESVLKILPMIGDALSTFFLAAKPFIDGISKIDESFIIGVGYLTAAILALTVAELINGIASFTPGNLTTLGYELSAFIIAAMPFLITASTLNSDAMAGVKMLAETILILTAADLLAGLTSFAGGNLSFVTFANELGNLGTGIKTFSDNTKGIDATTVEGGGKALKALAEASKSIPKEGGWLQKIVGESGMATFATNLPKLGTAIKTFSDNTKGLDTETVGTATDALGKLVDLSNEIPAEGGWLQKIVGSKDMSDFGDSLVSLGKSIVDFADETDGIDATQLEPAIGAIEALVALSKTMPTEDSWLKKFIFGTDDMDAFGDSIAGLGSGLEEFDDEVEDINIDTITTATDVISKLTPIANDVSDLTNMFGDSDDIDSFKGNMQVLGKGLSDFSTSVNGVDTTVVSKGASAGKSVAGMAREISNAGGLASLLGKGVNMTTFGTQLTSFGKSLKAFAATVANSDFSYVGVGANAGKQVASMAKEIANSGGIANFFGKGVKMDTFGIQLASFGSSIRRFSIASKDVDGQAVSIGVQAGIEMLNLMKVNIQKVDLVSAGDQLVTFGIQMKKFARTMGEADTDGLRSSLNDINNALSNVGKIGSHNLAVSLSEGRSQVIEATTNLIKSAIRTIDGSVRKFETAGNKLMDAFNRAVTTKKEVAAKIFASIVSSALAKISSVSTYNSFFYAGKNLATGFANGISANSYKAAAKASAMAEAAKEAAKEALKINSPSKVFYAIGSGIVEGFTDALTDGERQVFSSSADVANYATRGFNNAVSAIQRALSMDLDGIQPTIRPVLDLSEVSAGAGAISGMLNLNPTVGARSNINVISSAMNRRQNGMNNSDIVSAINDLGDAMGNSSGNTYNVNGITYDDGSAIATAIESLIRAATIERRI